MLFLKSKHISGKNITKCTEMRDIKFETATVRAYTVEEAQGFQPS